MVRKYYSRLILVFMLSALSCSGYARTVKEIKMNASGLTIEPDVRNTKEGCKDFKPTLAQVRSYFNKAYPVEAYVVVTDRYSPCYAEGTLKFSDGSFGDWVLFSSGTASFTFNRGDHVNFYYKYNKWNDPTACTYGLSDKGEC